MTLRATTGNVTPLRPRTAETRRHPATEAARYIAQMTIELERLANTADLELAGYFLSMARAEAEKIVGPTPAPGPQAGGDQAPYKAD